jgi:predicted nucleotidyltransferase
MIRRQRIQHFVDRVARAFQPERVIPFGSYAYGRPTRDSDVDLLVAVPRTKHRSVQAAEIRRRIRAGFPLDLLVRSPRETYDRLSKGDFFIREIMERGQPLYEA